LGREGAGTLVIFCTNAHALLSWVERERENGCVGAGQRVLALLALYVSGDGRLVYIFNVTMKEEI
jgi:hypothetical protein